MDFMQLWESVFKLCERFNFRISDWRIAHGEIFIVEKHGKCQNECKDCNKKESINSVDLQNRENMFMALKELADKNNICISIGKRDMDNAVAILVSL
jgi:hypothetical protein